MQDVTGGRLIELYLERGFDRYARVVEKFADVSAWRSIHVAAEKEAGSAEENHGFVVSTAKVSEGNTGGASLIAAVKGARQRGARDIDELLRRGELKKIGHNVDERSEKGYGAAVDRYGPLEGVEDVRAGRNCEAAGKQKGGEVVCCSHIVRVNAWAADDNRGRHLEVSTSPATPGFGIIRNVHQSTAAMNHKAYLPLLTAAGSVFVWWPALMTPSLDLPLWSLFAILALIAALSAALWARYWFVSTAAAAIGSCAGLWSGYRLFPSDDPIANS